VDFSERTHRLRRDMTTNKTLKILCLGVYSAALLAVYELLRGSLPIVVTVVASWLEDRHFRPPEMVRLPAGQFLMGSPSSEQGHQPHEGPQRRVSIVRPFELARFEVTFREWDVCVRDGGCTYSPSANGWGRGKQPVIYVSWQDAKGYLGWLSRKTGKAYRLPTEAEWEYAARAGTTTAYAFGPTIAPSQARFATDRAAPVGSYAPNRFGVYDMHGNVWEWVEDCYHPTYEGGPSDGSAWVTDCADALRVVRGGAWFNGPLHVRAASRDSDSPDMRYDIVGFRIARSIDE
jgi:formylglycine-generating enzyme required for sulfatase activity